MEEIGHLRRKLEEKEREARFWKSEVENARKEGDKFRMLFDSMGDAAYFRKDGGKFIEVNRAACDRLGYTREELLNMGIEDVLSNDSLARHQSVIEEIKSKGACTFFSAHKTKDGRILPTEVHSCLVHFENYDAILSISRDISEKIEAERRIKKSEEKYRNLFENALEGIFQADTEGHILDANPALAKMYGYDSPEELISTVTDVEKQLYVDPEDRKRLLSQLKENGFVSGFEVRRLRKDGSVIWVSLYIKAKKDEDGAIKMYEGRVVDITDKKKTEEALREINRSLEIKKASLEEVNTTLQVLIRQSEQDKKEMEERFASNIMTLVLPYVEKIKKGQLDSIQ
ncbi:MAG: PAS domain S-box protein, partial [Syntrophorhabdaceae bacterium]|nr:PAS domain S-box protein [Syntrophorhabdaceae bacterium]